MVSDLILLNGISNFMGYLMQDPSLLKNSNSSIQPRSGNKGFHTCPNDTCPKENEVTRLEFELACYDITVYAATRTH